ncbi:MAG: RNA methyltransferase [Oscillospiraceae bacterium]|nr:RNA methyltransferase [Oscillospiraceae bacterium]
MTVKDIRGDYDRITSRDNPLIKEMAKLAEDAAERRRSGRFVIEGLRLCADAAATGLKIIAALAAEDLPDSPELSNILAAAGRVVVITPAVAKALGDTVTPQGVFCLCESPDIRRPAEEIDTGRPYAALEDIRDPANLGAIIRTAEALGIGGLILSAGCADIFAPKVLRASMGGAFRLPVFQTKDLPDTLERLQKRGMTAFACVLDRMAEKLGKIRFPRGSIAVIGNEASGLSPRTTEVCLRQLTVPMTGAADSLNAAMAAGLIVWEMAK